MDDDLRARRGRVPAWWADAKLGIFIHWVPASVPGFAPTQTGITELLTGDRADPLASIPYSEWYENSLRFPASPVARFHRDHYGDRPYAAFAADFVAGLTEWDPEDWAGRFARTGARYVVLVAKHHDGWCLWPSRVVNPHRAGWHSERDLVGELAEAVRRRGMRFGLYYSGGYDWTFDATPIGSLAGGLAAIPRGDYPDYADAQVRELVERYQPSVLWNDIAWPTSQARLEELLGWYFEQVPDGVVNDRWMPVLPGAALLARPGVAAVVDRIARRSVRRSGGLVPPKPRFFMHRTPEFTTFERISHTPWECVRGMDQGFGYNRTSTEADHLTSDELIRSFTDIVATGGNLLLNVGPRGEDARIPDPQLQRLDWLGDWMETAGAALQDTRPWIRPRDRSPEGFDLRYAARGDSVFVLAWHGGPANQYAAVTVPFRSTPRTEIRALDGAALAWQPGERGLRVDLPLDRDESAFAFSVAGGEALSD